MVVAVLISDRQMRKRIAGALRDRATPQFCESDVQVEQSLVSCAAGLVITDVRDICGSSRLPNIRAIHARFPSIPMLACCWLERDACQDLAEAGRIGVSGLILRGYDDPSPAVHAMLARADSACARRRVASALEEIMPAVPSLRAFVDCCLAGPQSTPISHDEPNALTVNNIAARLHVSRRTLTEGCHKASLPSPHILHNWVRLLVAGCLLEDNGRSLGVIARSVGFASPRALRRAMKGMMGLRPTDVRRLGGFDCVLQALIAANSKQRNSRQRRAAVHI